MWVIAALLSFLIVILLLSPILASSDMKEHLTSCLDCCGMMKDLDYEACSKNCKKNGRPCDCCVLAVRYGRLPSSKDIEILNTLPRVVYEEKIISTPRPGNCGSRFGSCILNTNESVIIAKPTSVASLPYSVAIPGGSVSTYV